MRIGIDFNNTLIDYDRVFLAAARKRGLLAGDFIGSKRALRDTIRLIPVQIPDQVPATAETVLWCAQPQSMAAQSPDRARLSGREKMILKYLTRGATNKHIARELKIAEATVKVHMKSLLRKIGVDNRTQAAMWATDHLSEIAAAPTAL